MIVYGGYGTSGVLGDVWALELGGAPTWVLLAPAGSPPPGRVYHAAIYDPAGDRMIVFGGNSPPGDLGDLWQLTLSGTPAWSPLVATGPSPSARSRHTAIRDPVAARVIVYGGWATNDLWELTLGATPSWHQLLPAGTRPSAQVDHSAVHDPGRRRMLVFGGGGHNTGWNTNQTWALDLAGPLAWRQLAPAGLRPSQRCQQLAVFDEASDRLVLHGGQWCNGFEYMVDFDNAWALSFGGLVASPPEATEIGIELSPSHPNPAALDLTLSFSLPARAQVRLSVFDIAGRRVADLVAGEFAEGRHRVRWTRGDRRKVGVMAGMYFCVLEAGRGRVTRRFVVID
jgi:hypothetical protein